MKKVILIPHAEKKRRQKGLTDMYIEQVIMFPSKKRKRRDDRIEVEGMARNREIFVVYEERENYLRVITII